MAKKTKTVGWNLGNKNVHNTHLLLPEELWQKLAKRAKKDGCSVTDIIVTAATAYLRGR